MQSPWPCWNTSLAERSLSRTTRCSIHLTNKTNYVYTSSKINKIEEVLNWNRAREETVRCPSGCTLACLGQAIQDCVASELSALQNVERCSAAAASRGRHCGEPRLRAATGRVASSSSPRSGQTPEIAEAWLAASHCRLPSTRPLPP